MFDTLNASKISIHDLSHRVLLLTGIGSTGEGDGDDNDRGAAFRPSRNNDIRM